MRIFIGLLILVTIILYVTYPLILIWSVNTLLGLSIPYSIATYIAVGVIIWPLTIKVTKRED